MMRSIVVLGGAVLVAGAVVVSTVALGASDSPPPTKGPIPDEVFGDHSNVPEYIETIDSEGNMVGYTHRDWAYPDAAAVQRNLELYGPRFPGEDYEMPPAPVFADDLETIVGHMYPDVGFVPLGEKPGPSRVEVRDLGPDDVLD